MNLIRHKNIFFRWKVKYFNILIFHIIFAKMKKGKFWTSISVIHQLFNKDLSNFFIYKNYLKL